MKLEDIQSDAIEQLQKLMSAVKEAAESELYGLVQNPSVVMELIQQNIASNEFVLLNQSFWEGMFNQWSYSVDPTDLSKIASKIATDVKNKLDVASEAGIIVEFLGPKGKEIISKVGKGIGKFLHILKELAMSVFKTLASQHSYGYRGYRHGYRRDYGYNHRRDNRKTFKRSLLNPYIIYTFIEQAKSVADRNRVNKQNTQQNDQAPKTTGINTPELQKLTGPTTTIRP